MILTTGKISVTIAEHGQPALNIVQSDINDLAHENKEREEKRGLEELRKDEGKKTMPDAKIPYPHPTYDCEK